jgi:hypothetical protein
VTKPRSGIPAGPRAAAWDPAPVQTRFALAQLLIVRVVLPVFGAARVLHETIETSTLTDDKSIREAELEDMRKLVVALQAVKTAAERLKKRWGL